MLWKGANISTDPLFELVSLSCLALGLLVDGTGGGRGPLEIRRDNAGTSDGCWDSGGGTGGASDTFSSTLQSVK